MSEFRDKLQIFLQHYDKLNSLGEEPDEGFNSEFVKLKQETQHYKENNTFPAEAGQQPYNKKKNRFKDILPYEYTRVQLHKTENIEGSDYINANYVQGADNSVTYIAAQGPLPHTVEDFWRMLWYHQIEIVVMACKLVEIGRKKCEQYWPSLEEPQMYGVIKVTLLNEESISNDFTVREILAECQGEQQVIRQYHYNAWPDHGRPSSALPIIRMVERIGDHRKRHDIPIVVHCSAGCGRTGTIIAIDYARAMLLSEELSDELNVYNIVHEMRRQRPSMVQAKEQYVFVYVAIAGLIKRILGNVPQAPPKQLNFEKKEVPSVPCNVDENIYANVSGLQDMNPDLEHSTTESFEQTFPPNPKPIPPKPLARSSSGGRTESPIEGKPSPPLRKPKAPVDRPTPAKRNRSETPKKEPSEQAPHLLKTTDNVPVPIPRKVSPVSPPFSLTPPTSTPNKGYINVSGSQDVEATYSVVQKPATLPRETSTPKTATNNTSNSSILDMFMTECGDILPEINEDDTTTPATEVQASYSTLGEVTESDLPPDIPVKTIETMQFIVGDIPTQEGGSLKDIYETPDLTQPPSSTGLAFSTPVAAKTPQSEEPFSKAKKGKGVGLFNKKPKDVNKSGTHPALGKMHSAPRSSQTVPVKRSVANDKYHFPGELGFGIRVGKPRGPRPIPSHWSIPNGLVH